MSSKPIKRLWLQNIGVFEIITNSGKGSCLFQAISQALTFSSRFHYKIRMSTVNHMVSRKWSERLNDLPEFWKHKIIRLWLRRERAHFLQQTVRQADLERHQSGYKKKGSSILGKLIRPLRKIWCKPWFNQFIEKRRHKKYYKIKQLVQTNNRNTYSYLQSFKYIFQQFMSRRNEPGTRFELEAAANLFRFHFDYLQTIPSPKHHKDNSFSLESKKGSVSTELKITPSDILNENLQEKFVNIKEFKSLEDMPEVNPVEIKETQPITLKLALYRFHSCRKKCKLARGFAPEPYDHYFFIHSPNESNVEHYGETWENFGVSSSSGLTKNECGHWELLLPISILKHPVPLNRRIFGITYEITDVSRNFVPTRCGHRREIVDNVAKAIECFVEKNPAIIPPEDPLWPPDDIDDYVGCAAALMRDSFYQCKVGNGFKPSKANVRDHHDDECCWWHSSTRNINHREDIISGEHLNNENEAESDRNPFPGSSRFTSMMRLLIKNKLATFNRKRRKTRGVINSDGEEDSSSST